MAKIDDSVKKKVPELRFPGFTDDWEEHKLGEVATLSSSKRIHLSDYVTEGIPFYRGSEISTGGITGNQELFISQEKFDEIKEKYGVPSEGDILVTAVGTLGNLWKVDSRRFYYKDGNLIQISKMQVNSDYLLTYFTGGIGKKRLLDSAAGSNQKALTMVKMREITVDFPSEDEQKKIGAFFKSLDDTIALHQRKLDLLKEQKKGYLQKMFPKNGEKVPELRFAGFADDWEERKFKDIIEKLTGGASIKPSDYLEEGIRTIPKGAVNSTGLADLSGSKYISEEFYESNKSSHVSTNNLVTSLRDLVPSAPNMGRIVRIAGEDEDFLMPQGVYKLELFDGMDEEFLIAFSNSDKYRKIISSEKNGSTQVHIRNGEFLNIDIELPFSEEQKQIGSFFKQLDNSIALHQHKLDLLKEQKKGFLQKMFV